MSNVSDPIADFLTRLRNASAAQKAEMIAPYSKIKAEIARILKQEGYITDLRSRHRRGSFRRSRSRTKSSTAHRPSPASSASASPVCAIMSAPTKFRAFSAAWASPSSPRLAVSLRPRSQETKSRRRTAGLRLVTLTSYVPNRKKNHRDSCQGESQHRHRRRGHRRRAERQAELDAAAQDQGQRGRTTACPSCAMRETRKRASAARSLPRAGQQHGARA